MTTQDREPEVEKEKRIAEQNKNKRVKISTGITELTWNAKSMTINLPSERVYTVEPVKRFTGQSCRWCYLDICKIHESK